VAQEIGCCCPYTRAQKETRESIMRLDCFKLGLSLAIMTGAAACGPKFSPPNAPTTACPNISKTQFDDAVKAGATRARASINQSGIVSMTTYAGLVQCSSFKGSKQICRRPNDFVIQYTLPNKQMRFVLVPKNREYRLNQSRKPIPCEVLNQ
jgi:hypothetical protein